MTQVITDQTFVGCSNLILPIHAMLMCMLQGGNLRVTVEDLRNRDRKKKRHQEHGARLVTFFQDLFTFSSHCRQMSDKI